MNQHVVKGTLAALALSLFGLVGCAGEEPADLAELDRSAEGAGVNDRLAPQLAAVDGTARDMVNGAPVAAVTVRGCLEIDPSCASPSARTVTDEHGDYGITVPLNAASHRWDGYLDFMGPRVMPAIVYPLDAITGAPFKMAAPMIGPDELADAAESIGVRLDPARGHLLLGGDSGEASTGVAIRLDDEAGATKWYSVDGELSREAVTTTKDGMAGVMNVRPGPRYLMAVATPSGAVLARRKIIVRAGTLAVLPLHLAH